MFDQAFSRIATGFAGIAGGPFTDATVTWPGTPTMDAGGSITSAGTPVVKTCKAQIDAATQAMRLAEGFLETDVRILVLVASLDGTLDTQAKVTRAGVTYSLLSCTLDPAGVGYECRGRVAT